MDKSVTKVDVAVIGGGPGGSAVAQALADARLKTVIIDSGDIGGTCLNRGCVPSKSWLSAEHLYRSKNFAKKIGAEISKPDFQKIKEHQREVVGIMQKGLMATYKKNGVEIIKGFVSFLSPNSISLNNGETVLEFNHAVIATGSEPLDIFGKGERIYNSDTIFGIDEIPVSITIIGGGVIGIEMATFFSGMESEVTVVEALDDILPAEEAEIRATVKRELKKTGVTFKLGVKVETVEHGSSLCKITLGGGEVIKSRSVLVAIGRSPLTKKLSPEKAGIRVDANGYVITDRGLRSSNSSVYAVGDVAGKSLLAYTAHHEGVVAAKNIIGGSAKADYENIVSVVFSNPEIGSVGKREEELKKNGTPYTKGVCFIRSLARAHASGETAGLVKVLVGDDGAILGLHICGAGATELIHTGLVAIKAGMKAKELSEMTFGHPIIAEAIPLALHAARGATRKGGSHPQGREPAIACDK